MPIHIREVLLSDTIAICRLTHQLGYKISEEETRKNLEATQGNDNEITFVALLDQDLTGWIHVFFTTRIESGAFAEIGGLVVDEKHRRQGIGKMLIQEAISWCRNRGLQRLRLRTNILRSEAHLFYETLGFGEKKVQKVYELQIE